MSKIRVVQYINQFFAQIGGEEKADIPAELREGPVGPGLAFNQAWGEEAEVVATIICGDSYFNENLEKAQAEVLEMVKSQNPDMFIAGPAFNAGRYGVACGTIANAVNKMAPLALKLARHEAIGASCEEGYMPNGIRVNLFEKERGSKRAVKMLIAKLNGKPYTTEFPMPSFDRVAPNPAVKDMAHATVALCTSGGIVPLGNPDHIESSSASHYGEYDIEGVMDLTADKWATAHGGYDPVYANEDPDRVLPVDVLRDMEKEGRIGKLYHYFYTTVGNGTAVASSKAFAEEYAKKMKADGVDCVIMTST